MGRANSTARLNHPIQFQDAPGRIVERTQTISCDNDVEAIVLQSTFTASARAQAERAQIPVVLVGRDDLHRLTDLLLEAARAVPASRDVQSR
jgi:hypothetical protein